MNILDIDLIYFASERLRDEEPSLTVHIFPGWVGSDRLCSIDDRVGGELTPSRRSLESPQPLYGIFKEEPKGNYIEVGRGADRDQLATVGYNYQKKHGPMWLTIIRLGADGKPDLGPDPEPLVFRGAALRGFQQE